MKKIFLSSLILYVLVLIIPFILNEYGIMLATEISVMGIFALSLGLIMGYGGLMSLGHGAFFALGAYTVALLGAHFSNSFLLVLIAILITGGLSLLTGAIFIRTTRFYFLMITLAFGQMVYALLFQSDWAGGSDGLSVVSALNFGFGEISSPKGIYLVMGIALVIVYILLRLFVESPSGKIIKGIMENEQRMKSLGYDTRIYKLLALTISGSIAGLAGALYAYFNTFVSPELSYWMFSGDAMVMIIVGGVGTLIGPIVGSAFYIILQNFVSSYTEHWPFIIGILLVTLVLLGRGGVIHWFKLLAKVTMVKKVFQIKKESSTAKAEREGL